jgi:GNAT superfamily N-acetyltransferase
MALTIQDFVVEPANFAREQEAIAALRGVCNLAVSESATDAAQLHAVARVSWEQPEIIGALRLSPQGELSSLCVAPDQRGKGIARALLQWARDTARERGLARLFAWPARSFAADAVTPELDTFMQRVEFAADSANPGRYLHHFTPRAPLARIVDQQALSAADRFSTPIGGKTREALTQATLQVIAEVRRELCIYSRDLDPAVLNTNALLEALRALCLRPGASIRLLLQDSSRAVKDGHRLIELARRLPSSIEFRCPQAEDLQYTGAFVLNDNFGFLARSFGDRFECEGDLYHIAENARLKRYFGEVWERARVASEFRRLSL